MRIGRVDETLINDVKCRQQEIELSVLNRFLVCITGARDELRDFLSGRKLYCEFKLNDKASSRMLF